MENSNFTWTAFGFFILLIIAIAFTATEDKKSEQYQEQEYCAMVELHQKTNGDQGWPDFKHIYKDRC